MHGGRSRVPRTQAGKKRARRAVLKHGNYTKEAKGKAQADNGTHQNQQRYIESALERLSWMTLSTGGAKRSKCQA